jgi:putative oxidoreductase
MADNPQRIVPLVGRVFLSVIFIMAGYSKIGGWEETSQYMASRGMVGIPFFLAMAILFELGGGLSVLLGLKARLGALALFIFIVPTTFIFHSFWTYPPEQAQLQSIMFLKNLAIAGGLLMLAAAGPGRWSLDGRRGQA